jgi:hypothetical protein
VLASITAADECLRRAERLKTILAPSNRVLPPLAPAGISYRSSLILACNASAYAGDTRRAAVECRRLIARSPPRVQSEPHHEGVLLERLPCRHNQ